MKKNSGYVLADSLVALVIITVGILGLLQLQGAILNNSIESGLRIRAAMLCNELISMAQINSSDAACFTVPVANQTGCSNTSAKSFAQTWENEINSVFPGTGITKGSASIVANNRFSVSIQWQRTPQSTIHNQSLIGQLGL